MTMTRGQCERGAGRGGLSLRRYLLRATDGHGARAHVGGRGRPVRARGRGRALYCRVCA